MLRTKRVVLANISKEATTRIIDFNEENPIYIREMLRYLYTSSYESTQQTSPLTLHVEMSNIGDRFHITGLKILAEQNFETEISRNWPSSEILSTIHHIYEKRSSLDDKLPRIVCDAVMRNLSVIRSLPGVDEIHSDFYRDMGFALILREHTLSQYVKHLT